MKPVDAVLIGAGNRGADVYAAWAAAHPDRLRIAAVAEPDPARREAVARAHGIPAERRYADWRDALAAPRLAAAAIIATGDTLHVAPALASFERGYDVLLEKPIAPTPVECVRIVRAAEAAGCGLQIGHVLRYTPFYRAVHEVVASGELGELLHLDLREHVAHWHMAHSYVRGRFRNRALAAPILLAKACHDLDLLGWFADRPAQRVVSFGDRSHYRAERAPGGAPERCTDGCPVQSTCAHDAEAFYLGPDDGLARLWPWSDLGPDPSRQARRRALASGPYGRCVFRCDNDVLDHQVVTVAFEGGLTATFALQGVAAHEQRTLRITGSRGELRGVLDGGRIEIHRPGALAPERRELGGSAMGHFGGDAGLIEHFTACVARGDRETLLASGRSALASHLLGFAAEVAREAAAPVVIEAFAAAVHAEAE